MTTTQAERWTYRLFGAYLVIEILRWPWSAFEASLTMVVCIGMLLLLLDKGMSK